MAWYSYFLLALPEVVITTILTFVLLGISIKENRDAFIIYCLICSAIAFSLELFLPFSFKVYMLFIIQSLMISLIFKRKLLHGAFISLIFFVCLAIYQTSIFLIYISVFSLDISEILSDPWKRIFANMGSIIPMALTALILYKYKINFKVLILARKQL